MSCLRASIGLSVAVAAWFGAPAFAVEAHVDYDPTVDFSRYTTIGWLGGTPAADPLLERKIHASVERELVPNGLKEVREDPDLLLVTHSALEEARTIDVESFPYWSRYRGWRRPLAVAELSYDSFPGMLIVDLLDGQSRQLIWRAVATGIAAKKTEKRDEKLDRAMAKMFRGFPPKFRPNG